METDERIMNLRPRQENKELSRTFRFKATSQAERIADSVALNTGVKFPKSLMVAKEVDTKMMRAAELQNIEMKSL
jgi:hypothetical protein